ncbi:hypothetical protein GCM10017744_058590 [Streptomyces antimycoticus]
MGDPVADGQRDHRTLLGPPGREPAAPVRERDDDRPDDSPDGGVEATLPMDAEGVAGPVRRHRTYWSGISSRKRDGGLYAGWPQALRMVERVR